MASSRHRSKRVAQKVGDVLNDPSRQFGQLIGQARKNQKLNDQIVALLDPDMSKNVQVATVRDGCLVLITSSAALATRLRMDSDKLLESIARSGIRNLEKVEIRTAPLPGRKTVKKRTRELPEAARISLERFAKDKKD
jgi:hypothetical protein